MHHWDENDLFVNETTASLPPKTIVDVHAKEINFVLSWMAEWKQQKREATPFRYGMSKPL